MVQSLKKWRHYLIPKDFFVYTENHALSFFNSQEKLSVRHLKWMDQLQAYTFNIKHKGGGENKVANALSRRVGLLEELQLQSVGIDSLKHLYADDPYFVEIFQVCIEMVGRYHTNFYEYLI